MPKTTAKQDQVALLLAEVQNLRKEIETLKQQPPKVARKVAKGQPRPDVYYVLSGVPTQGLPPQAIACARILSSASNTNHISETEAMELIVAAAASGKLRTTQDPWHIFQYYRPRLIEGDFLRMLTLTQ
jgi:hypothetical protein